RSVAGPSSASDATIVFPEILDGAAAEAIRGELLRTIDSLCPAIRFDLRATRDLDVQGLALLAAAPAHLARLGRPSIELVGISVEIDTVLRVTGLAERYGVCQSAP